MTNTKDEIIQRLRSEIGSLERTPLADRPQSFVPSGVEQINALLPGGGLPVGCLVELLADEASGALTLALELAREAINAKPAWAIVDMDGFFYPPAVAQHGLSVEKLIVVRAHGRNATWALGQLLRCPDVGASVLCSTSPPTPLPRGEGRYKLDNMAYRRLQLAAERGGGLGFVLRPMSAIKRPCWAAVRLLVERASLTPPYEGGENSRQALKVTLLHVRGSSASGARCALLDRC